MTNFEILKLVTDFGLLGSLIYFAFRFIKVQAPVNTWQLQELHSGLKSAIRDADQAGRGLNEQLFQRKQNLEKLLFDLETVESRINRAINNAEQRKGELELSINKAKRASEEWVPAASPQPESGGIYAGDTVAVQSAPAPKAVRTNIYGEPIGAADEALSPSVTIEKAFNTTPLTTRIETDIVWDQPKKVVKSEENLPVEEVYTQAEELLRAGKAIDEVCKETQLTKDEVRLLSQMVDMEEEQKKQPVADERLGVLGGFKREVQVL